MSKIKKGKHKHLILFVLSFLGFCLVLFFISWRKSSEKYNESVMFKFFYNVRRKWAKHFADSNYGLDRLSRTENGRYIVYEDTLWGDSNRYYNYENGIF
ncbi:hypothetical protein [Capnocytophaga canis]|uniref:Uncharacterized protein n=1 Tax=Capnocytophaga canis TaxID=1848903 RepID=A0A0B7IPF6_9FLAO|nr:hypothetical protein [Capnocytophaga canis]CEN51917.1 exported hypothetical protein [Capnocytophaga canis]